MEPIFGQRLSDLYRYLPCIVAELAKDVSFPENGGMVHHQRGARAYFILRGDNPLDHPEAEVFLRTMLNNLRLRELTWDHFRFADIMDVPAKIGERCLHMSKDEMKTMLEGVRRKIQGSETAPLDFSMPLDLD